MAVGMKMYGKHRFPGRLFIVEGIDGSGKSTQLMLLKKWLDSEGYVVYFSEWNSSPLVHDVTKRGKKKKMLTPMTFSLIHATDFADRTEHHIIPPLKAGAVVLADRYVYTAFARDVVRGVSPKWVRDLYAHRRRREKYRLDARYVSELRSLRYPRCLPPLRQPQRQRHLVR